MSITAQGFRTLYDMIWDDHLIDEQPDGTCLIYIDRHLVDEVDSPQAFAALRLAGLRVHATELPSLSRAGNRHRTWSLVGSDRTRFRDCAFSASRFSQNPECKRRRFAFSASIRTVPVQS